MRNNQQVEVINQSYNERGRGNFDAGERLAKWSRTTGTCGSSPSRGTDTRSLPSLNPSCSPHPPPDYPFGGPITW